MTLLECYQKGKKQLELAGIDTAAFDALCLFEQVFGMNRQDLYLKGSEIAFSQKIIVYQNQIASRMKRQPLQYLLGEWPFRHLKFAVGPGVLIPREETELLVDFAMKKISEPGARILDLCSGSGAIAVSCAYELKEAGYPAESVTAVELSEEAIHYLKENATRNHTKIQIIQDDVTNPQKIENCPLQDIILSNPPYIPTKDLSALQLEVQWEPKMALDGGNDGLAFYRAILQYWLPRLKPGGWVAVECGMGQAESIANLFVKNGLDEVEITADFNDIARMVCGKRKTC